MVKVAGNLIFWLLVLPLLLSCSPGKGSPSPSTLVINGAGATFPYPLYSKWIAEYAKVKPEVRLDYQSLGSGAGVRQLTAGTVHFGASDVPMTDAELSQAPREVLHIPSALGAVVVVDNLPQVPAPLKLSPTVLADIFLGQLTRWNDVRLAELNPGLSLPDREIVVVYRSDGSGTTGVFTEYLSRISPQWASQVGAGKAVGFPVGIGAKGNEGVTGQVKSLPYTLGYVELAYAHQSSLPAALLLNRAGNFVAATLPSITAAAAAVPLPADLRVSIVDAPGENAYPLASFTYLLVYREQGDGPRGRALAEFLWWAIHQGQEFNEPLLYARLPAGVVSAAEGKLLTMSYQGQPLLAPTGR